MDEKRGRGRPRTGDLHTRSISFPADLYRDIQRIAEREERDVTSQIVKALREFVAEYKRENGEDLGPKVAARKAA